MKPCLTDRAVQNGATTLAEAFLFFVGASLVLGETYRSSRKEGKRRDDVKERLNSLEEEIETLRGALGEEGNLDSALRDLREQSVHTAHQRSHTDDRNQRLQSVLETIVGNGLKASWSALGHEDGMGQILPLLKANKELRRGDEENPTRVAFVGETDGGDSHNSQPDFVQPEDA